MATTKATPFEVHFDFERETKNTVRWSERPTEGADPAIGTLYVSKARVAELGDPKSLTVTINAN